MSTQPCITSETLLNNDLQQKIPSKFSAMFCLRWLANLRQINLLYIELVNFCLSPPVPVSRRSTRNSATTQYRLPCPRACANKTPGKGSSVDDPHPEFVERSADCDGMFPSVKHDSMKKDQRMKCSVCKQKAFNFCWKCRRYLCNETPL